jgi:hypothetical protein
MTRASRGQESLLPPLPVDEKRMLEPFIPNKLPAVVPTLDARLIQPKQEIERYITQELCTPKLDEIHGHLHFAGAPRLARPLHRQKLMGREISVTEDPDEHLVWYQDRIFVKPLNGWLLDSDFWEENICSNRRIYEAACGFLLSYMWLVCYESDFKVGQDLGLLPKALTWSQWTIIQNAFMEQINTASLHQVSRRYQYGELRLTRLNRIYRWIPTSTWGLRQFVRGYLAPSTWYQEFFKRHFGWYLAVFAFFTVALSVVQVGLAVTDLQGNLAFQSASYGFTVFSGLAVVGTIGALLLTWFILMLFHYISAKIYHRRVMKERKKKREEASRSADG